MSLDASAEAARPRSRAEALRVLARLQSLVGWTPVHCLEHPLGFRLCVKLEYGNPTGSHKDRIALYMLRAALREGFVSPGGCVAEVSSGNTAAAVAWAASLAGLRPLLFVEKTASPVKKSLIRLMGGELVEIGDEGLTRDWAREEARRRGCVFLDQMDNENNMLAHYETTGRELLHQLHGRVDAFVMGVGTGGTVTGVGRRLREELGNTLVVAVAPKGSPVAGGPGAGEGIEGLASGSAPGLFRRYSPGVVDRVEEATLREALRGVLRLYRLAGVLAGPSTGAALAVAERLAEEGVIARGSTVAIIAADSLTRYPPLLEELAAAPP